MSSGEDFQTFFGSKSHTSKRLIAADELLSFVPEKELFDTIGAGCNCAHDFRQLSFRKLIDENAGAYAYGLLMLMLRHRPRSLV